MEFTGERYLPSVEGIIAVEHWHRYAVIAPLCAGKRVLDVACGEGYGAALLAEGAAEVVGVDTDAEAVAHAGESYAAKGNLRFEHGTLPALALPDAGFDVIVSFETLEHVPDAAAAMDELKRLLRPGGLLIASTPDRSVYSDKQGNRNPFHTHELDRAEFEALCSHRFAQVRIVGQKVYLASVIGAETPAQDGFAAFTVVDGKAQSTPPAVTEATYLIVLCSDAALPDAPLSGAMFDNSATAHAERESLMDWAQSLKHERDSAVSERDSAAAERDALLEQAEFIRQERDGLAAENMELRHSIQALQRQQGHALERMANDLAALKSSDLAERIATETLAGAKDHFAQSTLAALKDEVTPLLRGQADLVAQLAALGRQRALDIEALRSAIDHDRLVVETMTRGLTQTETMMGRLAQTEVLQAQIDAMHTSTSWLITAPLRKFGRRFKRGG